MGNAEGLSGGGMDGINQLSGGEIGGRTIEEDSEDDQDEEEDLNMIKLKMKSLDKSKEEASLFIKNRVKKKGSSGFFTNLTSSSSSTEVKASIIDIDRTVHELEKLFQRTRKEYLKNSKYQSLLLKFQQTKTSIDLLREQAVDLKIIKKNFNQKSVKKWLKIEKKEKCQQRSIDDIQKKIEMAKKHAEEGEKNIRRAKKQKQTSSKTDILKKGVMNGVKKGLERFYN